MDGTKPGDPGTQDDSATTPQEASEEQRPQPDQTGAYDWDRLVDEDAAEPPPEEFSNPAGVSRGDCDAGGEEAGDCDLEVTAEVDDLFLEETKPGIGISGFEGEEDGGG